MKVELTIKDSEVRELLAEALGLPGYQSTNDQPERPGMWIPASEPPLDGQKVVVRTKDDCIYFETCHGGKLMKQVAYWYPLPSFDRIKKGDQDGKES